MEGSCCTCAQVLPSESTVSFTEKAPRTLESSRRLPCCARLVCRLCLTENDRFNTYCPFCQISSASAPNPLPAQGLKEPPPYSPPSSKPSAPQHESSSDDDPPPYTAAPASHSSSGTKGEDVIHFVHPAHDTLPSLALRYNVPADKLRARNGLFSDHLLSARRTVTIPREYYSGASLSPSPIEGAEEEERKAKVRRWMVTCKVAEYDMALVYLDQAKYDLDSAVERYLADERWERENPLGKGKSRR